MTVSTTSSLGRTNLTWLPFWPCSVNPAASRRRLISRKGSGLRRPNFDLYGPDCGRARCAWFLEMQFERLTQIRECLFFRFTLTRHVYLKALRDVPFCFTPDGCRKLAIHTPHCFTMTRPRCSQCAPTHSCRFTSLIPRCQVDMNLIFGREIGTQPGATSTATAGARTKVSGAA